MKGEKCFKDYFKAFVVVTFAKVCGLCFRFVCLLMPVTIAKLSEDFVEMFALVLLIVWPDGLLCQFSQIH